MARRLNDTAALVGVPEGSQSEHSLSSRKIANGFVVRESSCNPATGEYRSAETFYKSQPKLVPGSVAGEPADANGGLADAMKYLNNDK